MLAITRWVVAFAMLLGTTSAFAQTYTYSVYVDTDNNAATGCAVTLPNGSFTGVESVLTATVNAGSPPTVASVTRSTCSAGSFGAAVSEGVGAVSVGAGTGGTTSIELGDALASLGASPTQTLRFYVVSRSAAGDDVLLTTNGDPAGSPIVLALTQFAPVPAPYAGLPTLLLLGGILLLFGSRAARRKTMKRLMLGLVLVSGVAGAGIFNWNLVSMLATDPAGDTTSGESALDLRYFYATLGGSTLEFRLDVAGNLAIVAPPAVTSIAPTAGPLTAGTSVIITGTNFTATTAVKFGGTNATMYTINSATRITATAPAGGAGTVDVTVTTVAGTSATSAADQFTYVAPPTVSGVAPTVGPTSGGTTVIITGTNLSGASAVKFGGTNAAAYTVNSATQITATSPAGAAGTVDVTVTTVGGTSATSSADQYTYTPAPAVTAINPTSGPTAGNTTVIITGSNFSGASAVKFGGTNATTYTVNSATQITATSPASAAGTVDITVTTVGGTSATGAPDQFTYVAPPTVTGIAPTAGPLAGGTSVTITGTNLTGASAVKFGATPAGSFTLVSATQIMATAPAGTGVVDVTVTTVGGTSATGAPDQFTYVPLPTVTAINPTVGPTSGGTTVIITGTNLSGASAVTFGGNNAASYTVNSATQITAISPAGAAGTVNITVTTMGGTSATSSADQYTYTPAPAVTAIAPASGPTAGGTTVVITGSNFSGASAVKFGGNNAASYTVNSATQITAIAPAGAAGTVDVTVTAVGGTSTTGAPDQYTYVAPPTVTSIAPTAGPLAGGTSVTITGTNFSGATAVKFGGTNATAFTVVSATQITATAPAGTGVVDVTVTTVGGTSATSSADQFTYVPLPTVTGISPTAGPLAGGTSVVITGTNFSGATAVKFGGNNATSYTVNSATQITATSPAGAAGTVDITVTTVGGTSATSSADQFTYVPLPTVTGINPTTGPASGGTTVVITGNNFNGASAVKFGGNNAASYVVNSATQITAIAPAGAAGTVDVTVTTVGGTSATGAPDQYTYVAPPTVTSIAPTAGPLAGGTSVTITGTNLTGASAVKFGATPAGSFTLVSATQITATAPAGSGTIDVTVTTVGGTSATSSADQFTYVPLPTITAINPTVGPTSGGTTVIITGTNLSGASAVTFGGNNAAAYTVNSATQITATSPAGAAGPVDITVTTVGGTSATSAADQFTYTLAPAVTAISPTAGPTTGGTTVVITGSNFTGATAVTFGGNNAAFTVNTATQITATSPAAVAGTVHISVTTPAGTSTTSAADQYTYGAAPTASSLTPIGGPITGGTSVTIAGTNFVTGATTVTIGGNVIPAGSVTVNSATSLTFATPAHAAGNVAVTVSTVGGTSAAVPGGYTYAAPPTISNLSPNSGGTVGGTSVTITGTNLAGASSVTFDGLAATIVTNTATQIVANTPAHALGVVDVVVTTAGGTVTASGAFTYVNPPVANNDSYSTVGNTTLVVGEAPPTTPYVSVSGGVLGNDTGTGAFTISLTQGVASGILMLNSNTGTFIYKPNAGFTGTDTFKYTITDASTLTSAPATVTITVSGRVKYVNGAAATNGTGVSSSPFNTLAGVTGASGDVVFVQSGGSPTTTPGAISLGAGVTLWGQGTSLPQVSGMTIANTAATSKPKLTGAVTLAGNNITVSSLDIDTSATSGTTALTNTGTITGALLQNNVTAKSAGAAAVNLSNASGNFTLLSVSASSLGTGSGIVLNTLGGTGFTITGDGSTAGSGGTISGACSGNPTGCGAVTPNNAGTVSLNFMSLSGPTGSGVYATNTALTVANSSLSNFAVVGVFMQTSGATVGSFNIHDNTLNGTNGDAIQLQHNSSGTWTGHIKTNAIGTLANAKSGSTGGDGIGIDVFGTGKGIVDVSSNTVVQIGVGKGISATASSAGATLQVSLLNNKVNMQQISSQDGMTVGSAGTVCLNATGNTSAAAGTAAGTSLYDMTGLSVLQNTTSSVFQIQGYGGSATNDTAVQTYLATNPGAPNNVLSGPAGPAIADHTSQGNTNGFGTATCSTAP